MEKQSYIGMMKLIESAVPQTTDFDYRKIDVENFFDVLNKLLISSDLKGKFSEKETILMEKQIKILITNINDFCKSNANEAGFDQNNGYLKKLVAELRRYVSRQVLSKIEYVDDLAYVDSSSVIDGYGDIIGDTKEIEEYISYEHVLEYVKKLFAITKTNDTRRFTIDEETIVDEIYRHFGFKKHKTVEEGPDTFEADVFDAIGKVLHQSRIYLNDSSYVHSDVLYSEQCELLIENVVNIICHYANNALFERRLREADDKEKEETQTPVVKSDEQTADKASVRDYEEIIAKYDKMMALISKNKELIVQIEKLKLEIAENEKKIAEIGGHHVL